MSSHAEDLKPLADKLRELRQYFFENSDAVGPYVWLYEDLNQTDEDDFPIFRKIVGTLQVIQSVKPVHFKFTTDKDVVPYEWPRAWFEKQFGSYELLGLWSYQDGTYIKDDRFDSKAEWLISKEFAEELESQCKEIDVAVQSAQATQNEVLFKNISVAIRGGHPIWMQGKVVWTYLRDLDAAIKAINDAEKQPNSVTEVQPENKQGLTDTEATILEALGNDTLKASELLKKAGYDNSSHYRTILANLKKRNILGHSDKGYYRQES